MDQEIKWLDDVALHDYASALAYLTLKLGEKDAKKLVRALRGVGIKHFRANDILRAASLSPAPRDDPKVLKDRDKMVSGQPLSPILLVNLPVGVDIADGYHRVSAVYYENPDEKIPCHLA